MRFCRWGCFLSQSQSFLPQLQNRKSGILYAEKGGKKMQKNILISKKTAKKIMTARQKAIQKEKAEKYWEKEMIHEGGCVAARQMEIWAVRIRKR